jgi:hypothetical protein
VCNTTSAGRISTVTTWAMSIGEGLLEHIAARHACWLPFSVP